jgi:ABC-type phosphate/phosphonate transport system permease subunit
VRCLSGIRHARFPLFSVSSVSSSLSQPLFVKQNPGPLATKKVHSTLKARSHNLEIDLLWETTSQLLANFLGTLISAIAPFPRPIVSETIDIPLWPIRPSVRRTLQVGFRLAPKFLILVVAAPITSHGNF